jgi:YVTN family beta-propeller protein
MDTGGRPRSWRRTVDARLPAVASRIVVVAVGLLLLGAPSALAQNAFVTNFSDGTLTVVDTANDTAAPTPIPLPSGASPGEVAITPDGLRAYVIDSAHDSVDVVNTATMGMEGSAIAVGNAPAAIAIAPDGSTAYVANGNEGGTGSVSVIDLTTTPDTVIATPSVGAGPDAIAVSPDGSTVLVGNTAGNTVSVINTTSHSVTGSPVTVGTGPIAIAFTPAGKAFVANNSSGNVSVLTFPGPAVATTISGPSLSSGLSSIAINPDGTRGFVGNRGSNQIAELDTVNNQLESATIGPTGINQPEAIAFTPDGDKAYVANRGAANVAAIDVATGAVTTNVGVGNSPSGVAIVPNQVNSAFSSTVAGPAAGFDGSASIATAGIALYSWDFGDGTTSHDSGPSAVHLYSAPGPYQVTLKVTDRNGCQQTIFTGQTASCNAPGARATVNPTFGVGPPGPPGPAGPPGAAAPPGLGVVLSSRKFQGTTQKPVTIRFGTSLPGLVTLSVIGRRQRNPLTRTRQVAAGAGAMNVRIHRAGVYTINLQVTTADGQTAAAGAKLKVLAGRRGRKS